MPAQSWHAYSYRVLSSADDACATLGVVLKAEDELCQHLGVHIRQLIRPHFLDHVACRGAQSAAFPNLESRLKRYRYRPSWSKTRNIRLVDPGACKIEACRDAALDFFKLSAGTGSQAFLRRTLQHYVFHPSLLADPALIIISAVFVHHKDIRLHDIQRREEIQNATALIYVSVLHITDALHHKKTFLFTVNSLVVLVALDGFVAANSNIQITVLSRLSKEFNVTAM